VGDSRGSQSGRLRPRYAQHHPERTVLFGLVRDHLESFLAHARRAYRRAVPRYAEQELRAYLKCGIHAHGFARARCADCGHELLVAFSCKKRGVCPSCNVRRMTDTAARLPDHVLPDLRLRQWVLSVPFELRILLARHPQALSTTARIFVEELFRWQRCRALLRGHHAVRGAAVCFPQRFGGSLNLNVHFHVVAADAYFHRGDDGAVRAEPLQKPTRAELEDITHNVTVRVLRWLRRRRLLVDSEPDLTQPEEPTALDACLHGSLGLGALVRLKPSGAPVELERSDPDSVEKRVRGGAFNIHAGVTASSREERELLLRYCARPPLSLERLSVTPGGQVAYALKRPIRGATHRLLSPLDFLARLTALIPPPRHPLIRFFGVVAPHSSWRKEVTPATRPAPAAVCADSAVRPHAEPAPRADVRRPQLTARDLAPGEPERPSSLRWVSTPLDWATLLRRAYDIDSLACPCGGRLRFLELLDEPDEARAQLRARGLPADPHTPRQRPPAEVPVDLPPDDDFDAPRDDALDPLPDLEAPDPPPPDDW
jgi:hypothetical protein